MNVVNAAGAENLTVLSEEDADLGQGVRLDMQLVIGLLDCTINACFYLHASLYVGSQKMCLSLEMN